MVLSSVQVSQWRKGRVADWQEGTQMLTVQPWPDPSMHPLKGLDHEQQVGLPSYQLLPGGAWGDAIGKLRQ